NEDKPFHSPQRTKLFLSGECCLTLKFFFQFRPPLELYILRYEKILVRFMLNK
ncbi:hypothetical protein LCGC14_2685130, partial [marine sediment metagenome]